MQFKQNTRIERLSQRLTHVKRKYHVPLYVIWHISLVAQTAPVAKTALFHTLLNQTQFCYLCSDLYTSSLLYTFLLISPYSSILISPHLSSSPISSLLFSPHISSSVCIPHYLSLFLHISPKLSLSVLFSSYPRLSSLVLLSSFSTLHFPIHYKFYFLQNRSGIIVNYTFSFINLQKKNRV